MVSGLKNYMSRMSGNKNPYLGVVHRLDQPVEGLLVFAKTKRAAAELSAQLADGRLKKKYVAVLRGIPDKEQDVRIDYLKKDGKSNLSRVVSESETGAKRAQLSYRVLAENGDLALAEIEIMTGRHHQIRVQTAHMGCPILGDLKYGGTEPQSIHAGRGGVPERQDAHAGRGGVSERQDAYAGSALALCAYQLEFISPSGGERRRFSVVPENTAFESFREYFG